MKRFLITTIYLGISIIFLPAALNAQWTTYSPPWNSGPDIAQMIIEQNMMLDRLGLRQMQQRRQQKQGAQNANSSRNKSQNARPVTNSAPANLTFIPAKNRILPGILAEKFGKTPQEKTQIFKRTVEEFDAIEKIMRERGRRLYDLAEMSTILTQYIFDVYFGKELDPRQRQGVAAMFADYYSRDTEIQAMDDKQKQLYYELTMQLVRMIHTLNYFGNLDKKPQMVREAKQAAARAAETVFGTSIDNLKLTADGIEF